jgi:hypothetical protein
MTIEQLLQKLGLEGCRYEISEDEDHKNSSKPTYLIHTPRSKMDEAYTKLYDLSHHAADLFYVELVRIKPVLVPAEVGQFVRVYQEREDNDDASPLGIVVSKQQVNGVTVYGCSHIIASISDGSYDMLWEFRLTGESYGGYLTGFLKIVPPEEVLDVMYQKIEEGYTKAIDQINKRRSNAITGIPDLIKMLTTGQTHIVERWSPAERPHRVRVDLQEVEPILIR